MNRNKCKTCDKEIYFEGGVWKHHAPIPRHVAKPALPLTNTHQAGIEGRSGATKPSAFFYQIVNNHVRIDDHNNPGFWIQLALPQKTVTVSHVTLSQLVRHDMLEYILDADDQPIPILGDSVVVTESQGQKEEALEINYAIMDRIHRIGVDWQRKEMEFMDRCLRRATGTQGLTTEEILDWGKGKDLKIIGQDDEQRVMMDGIHLGSFIKTWGPDRANYSIAWKDAVLED